jgi:hypothetical protein
MERFIATAERTSNPSAFKVWLIAYMKESVTITKTNGLALTSALTATAWNGLFSRDNIQLPLHTSGRLRRMFILRILRNRALMLK